MKDWRLPSTKEQALLNLLASQDFLGNTKIAMQLKNCKVRTLDKDGTIEIKVDTNKKIINAIEIVSFEPTVLVEAELKTNIYPIYFLLHVHNGYAFELEVYREDFGGENHINNIDNFSKLQFFIR
jgi:hypothetical protein